MFTVFARSVYKHKRCVYDVFMDFCVYQCLCRGKLGSLGPHGSLQQQIRCVYDVFITFLQCVYAVFMNWNNVCLWCVYQFCTVFMMCLWIRAYVVPPYLKERQALIGLQTHYHVKCAYCV